ncbi:MAG: RNA polymerase sigma factor [Desulfobacterales bacterium]
MPHADGQPRGVLLAGKSDRDIVERVLGGDADAFSGLMDRYADPVEAIVKKHVPRDQVAETCQDVFIRAYRSLHGLKDADRFRQWISSIAVRTCHDFWRRHYRNRETPESGLSEAHLRFLDRAVSNASDARWREAGRRAEAREILDWVLDRLSPEDRMILELIYLEDLSGREAAELLGWSVANVKVRTFRARKAVRKLLGKLEKGK